MVTIPQVVVEHCNAHPLCKGCSCGCSANITHSYEALDADTKRMTEQILKYIGAGS
jgi:hypothetical protein